MPFLKLPDVDLYYEANGNGDPVIFIQGVGVVGHGWQPQAEPLSKVFNTITIDNRGIGRSLLKIKSLSVEDMADDVLRVMDHLQIENAHIVGHSMGGSIALEFSVRNPKRVKSLALLCTFAKGSQATKLNSRIFWLGLRSRLGTRASRRSAFLEMLFSKKFLSSHADTKGLAESTGRIVGRDLADSPPIIMRQLKALSKHDRSRDLVKLGSKPVLIVSAKEDPIALPKFGHELAANIPRSKFVLLDDASHGIVVERPLEINNLLIDHFSRC